MSETETNKGGYREIIPDVIVDAMKSLNETAKNIVKTHEEEAKKQFVFNPDGNIPYYIDVYMKDNILRNEIEEEGYTVTFNEYLDIKDVTKTPKYIIRITDINNCFVEFSYFDYRKVVLDYMESERDFIYNYLLKLSGSSQAELETIADKICNYLSYLCHFKELQTKVYENIGWDDYNGEKIFKYDIIYDKYYVIDSKTNFEKLNDKMRKDLHNDNIKIIPQMFLTKSKCNNEISDSLINPNHNKETFYSWLANLDSIMFYSSKSALIIAAAVTGIVRQLLPYTKENNINMNIVGKPAHGKSIISHYALSFFGDPKILEGSFVDTDAAMSLIRVKRPVIPYMLDERMLKIEDSTERVQQKTLLMNIFQEYEGKAKEKLSGVGSELSGQRTNAPIISTSVKGMLNMIKKETDLGQYRRFIEIELEDQNDLFADGKMADKYERLAYEQYGYGIEMLIPYIIAVQEQYEKEQFALGDVNDHDIKHFVYDKYEKWSDKLTKELGDLMESTGIKGLKSSSNRFALILTTLELMLDALNDNWNNVCDNVETEEIRTDSIKVCDDVKTRDRSKDSELVEKVKNILIKNLLQKMEYVNNYGIDIDIIDNIRDFIVKYRGTGIFSEDIKLTNGDGCCARLVKEGDNDVLVLRKDGDFFWIAAYGKNINTEDVKNYVYYKCDTQAKQDSEYEAKSNMLWSTINDTLKRNGKPDITINQLLEMNNIKWEEIKSGDKNPYATRTAAYKLIIPRDKKVETEEE